MVIAFKQKKIFLRVNVRIVAFKYKDYCTFAYLFVCGEFNFYDINFSSLYYKIELHSAAYLIHVYRQGTPFDTSLIKCHTVTMLSYDSKSQYFAVPRGLPLR